MTRALIAAAMLAAALTIGGCGSGTPDASGTTPSEARQLNEAAAMLDANSISVDAVTDNSTNQDQQ